MMDDDVYLEQVGERPSSHLGELSRATEMSGGGCTMTWNVLGFSLRLFRHFTEHVRGSDTTIISRHAQRQVLRQGLLCGS
jgi:hypothetical protein